MNTTDPFDLLTTARPTDASLEATWTSTRSDATLVELQRLAEDDGRLARLPRVSPRRRSTRRWAALGAAAAVTAVAAFGATSILTPDGSLPQASAVERLASAASAATTPELAGGQFIHIVLTTTQARRDESTPQVDVTNESWAASDGTVWRRDVRRTPPAGTTYYEFPALDSDDVFDAAQPADYLQWPTDPAELKTFLLARLSVSADKKVDGSQPIFETLGDRLALGTTPAALNATMIRVLGSLPEVSVSTVRYDGHDAVKLEYRGDYVEALFFDKDSARFLGETGPGTESKVSAPEVVTEVPAEVLKNATLQGSGDDPASVNSN